MQYYAVRSLVSRRGPWQARKYYESIGELQTDDHVLHRLDCV
ncbi:MAG: hypothetical protein QM775_02160 [Pirellulales bacterium]